MLIDPDSIDKNLKISWSQYRLWRKCPHKHWLIYRLKEERDPPSKWTDYGNAVHNTAEDWFDMVSEGKDPDFDPRARFISHFVKIARPNVVDKVYNDFGSFKDNEIVEWGEEGKICVEELIDFITDEFEGWEIFAAEHDLLTPLDPEEIPNYWFNGFIDLVLRKGDKFFIIDYKTCSWGWGSDKFKDPYTMGQIKAYAWYFAQQHPDLVKSMNDIEMGYVLVKRTAKPGSKVQLLTVKPRKDDYSDIVTGLGNMVSALEEKRHPAKGRLFKNKYGDTECDSFGGCRFKGTSKCPKTKKSKLRA